MPLPIARDPHLESEERYGYTHQRYSQPLSLPHVSPTATATPEYVGYLFQIIAAFSFAASDVTLRFLGHHTSLPSATVLFYTALVQTGASVSYVLFFTSAPQQFVRFQTREWCLLLARSLAGTVTMLAIIQAFRHLPAGDTVALLFLGPVMFVFLGPMFLSEPLTKPGVMATVLGFVGVLLVSRGPSDLTSAVINLTDQGRSRGIAYALLAALSSCFSYITTRSLVSSVHFMTPVLFLSICSLFVAIALGGTPSPYEDGRNVPATMYAIVTGGLSFFGNIAMSYGLRYCEAGSAYLVRNLQVPFTYILAIFWLSEKPALQQIMGSSLVVLGTLIVGFTKTTAPKK